jgi:hypothetical protein
VPGQKDLRDPNDAAAKDGGRHQHTHILETSNAAVVETDSALVPELPDVAPLTNVDSENHHYTHHHDIDVCYEMDAQQNTEEVEEDLRELWGVPSGNHELRVTIHQVASCVSLTQN